MAAASRRLAMIRYAAFILPHAVHLTHPAAIGEITASMKVFQFRVLALLLLVSFQIASGAAEELTLTPYIDAVVSEANPATNYTTGDLAIGKTAGLAWESFLQFDVSSLPANAVLTAAELRLASPVGFGSGGSLQISAPAAGWSEITLTWTNRPAVTALADAPLWSMVPTRRIFRCPLRSSLIFRKLSAQLPSTAA